MSISTRYWQVQFAATGAVASVTELEPGAARDGWVIVDAPDERTARQRAYNIYCARKKAQAIARHRAVGECACGRKQDRKHPSGKPMLTCSVCAERSGVYNERSRQRAQAAAKAPANDDAPVPSGMAARDEGARVAANLTRQRDRRAEIRLETLIEVRKQWIDSPNIQRFGKWLQGEIDRITGANAA